MRLYAAAPGNRPMRPTLLQLIGALQLGIPCPICEGSMLYWDERRQDVDVCPDCDRLAAFFRAQDPEPPSNVIRLYRSPDTGRLDTIPF